MKYERLEIPELILCKPDIYQDDRGYFLEAFRLDSFSEFIGENVHFCQENESKSTKGVVRGLHYQLPPFAQAKLVRVVKGSVLDVVVDIRKKSPTFGKHLAIQLDDKNKFQLFIPKGFAHGFIVLSNEAIFSYKVDNYYDKKSERGIAFDDPDIGISNNLDFAKLKLSNKDKQLPNFREAEYF